ncbi:MAG: hypothetical protein CFE38_13850 [Comamonadaceae bacterium PBBC1]|nr:MAG: hypothetical protein CFE38_13850 [Comamonadaceae bacterium PBBC1]
MQITNFFKKNGALINISLFAVQIIFTVVWWFATSGVRELSTEVVQSVREIKIHTQKLSKNLETSLVGGITVKVGVNPREINENLLVVYHDSNLALKAGDTVQLSNFTDNTFQASLRFIVQKIVARPTGDVSNAQLFMSEAAAKRIGFDTFKRTGVIDLKLTRFSESQPVTQQVSQ